MTADLDAWRAALTELEAATGPSRKIDAKIARGLGWQKHRRPGLSTEGAWWTSGGGGSMLPAWTADLTAAVALVEREMPNANYWIRRVGGEWRPGFLITARVAAPYSGNGDHEDGFPDSDGCNGTTPALALLTAFARAKIAERENADA